MIENITLDRPTVIPFLHESNAIYLHLLRPSESKCEMVSNSVAT